METATEKIFTKAESDLRVSTALSQQKAKLERDIQLYQAKPEFLKPPKEQRDLMYEQGLHLKEYFTAIGFTEAVIQSKKKLPLAQTDEQFTTLVAKNPQYYAPHIRQAAFSEASNGAGGYTVPTFIADYIWQNVERFGFARRTAMVMPMGTKTIELNTGGTVTVSHPGDNAAATPFDATSFFTQVSLTAFSAQAIQIFQKELLQDTAVPVLQYIAKECGFAFAKDEDQSFFSNAGSNLSPSTGLWNTSGTQIYYLGGAAGSGKTSVANVSWTDLIGAYNALNTTALQNAVLFISQTAWSNFRKEASSSRPIWDMLSPQVWTDEAGINPFTGNKVARPPMAPGLWTPGGVPCVVLPNGLFGTQTSANTVIGFIGNLQNIGVLGLRQDITSETFDQATAGVDLSGQRQISLNTTQRYGVAFPNPSAGALIYTSLS